MTWSAFTDGTRVRYLLNPEDEDLTGWTELVLPDGFEPEAGRWTVEGGEVVPDLAALKLDVRKQAKANRDSAEWGGINVPGGPRIDTDIKSQGRIAGGALDAFIALSLGEPWTETWWMADGTPLIISAQQMVGIGRMVKAHVSACQQHKGALDAQIESAITVEDLEALDITSEWPS